MATFRTRKNKDGNIVYIAVVRRKRENESTFQRSKSFSKKKLAEAWARNLESRLDEEGTDSFAMSAVTVSDLIDKYCEKFRPVKKWGRTKEAALLAFKKRSIGSVLLAQLRPKHIIDYALERTETAQGSTIGNDLTFLSAVFATAKPVFGYDFDAHIFEEARKSLNQNQVISKSKVRDRRPTLGELERLCDYFTNKSHSSLPMADIIWFAVYSARRLSEITRLEWSDLDVNNRTCIVRDLKHPTHKDGNHQTFKMTSEAIEIIIRQPADGDFIFSYNPQTISAMFTRACKVLEIEDLRFHDLRHEAVSRLFEKGYQIQEVCMFSLHTQWSTLKRYTNLRAKDVREL